ncbi:MAG TPA: trigger factor [Solirubrobacteraceae bacterium]
MPVALKTAVTELPESRVRLEVEVPAGEIESSVERKARELGRSLRLPGFRRGKVPAPLVIQRVGRQAVLEEAVRDRIPAWYADAVLSSGIVPVGDPSVDLGELPPEGQSLEFSVEIGVLPKAKLGDYKGLEVGRREPLVEDERIDQEIEALRERLARLETAERPAESGDFVVIDCEGELVVSDEDAEDAGADATGAGAVRAASAGAASIEEMQAAASRALSGRDQLIELGSGRLPEEVDAALLGASAGEQRTVELSFPQDQGEPLAGRPAKLAVDVKEVKRKELPPLDDDLAIDAGFDNLEELREDIRSRLEEAESRTVEGEFREAALDAAVDAADVQTPQALVQARAKEMWERMVHSLAHRGISRDAYLAIDGRPEQQLIAELESDAERALRREAVLTAVVAAEGIVPSDEQLEAALASVAAERETQPSELLEELRKSGRVDELREELAARTAIDLIAEQAQPIALERAKAREQLWTPEKQEREQAKQGEEAAGEQGEEGEAGGLWTPGR